MPRAVRHNSIAFISPVDEAHKFRRTIQKRGSGLHKKAMEFAIISGARVFLAIELNDGTAECNTTLCFTSRGDRDWKKHLTKLQEPKKPSIRLDTTPLDYYPIFDPDLPPRTLPHSRNIKHPWFWSKTTASRLLPQMEDGHAAKSAALAHVLDDAQGEVLRYFDGDKERLQDSLVVQSPLNPEENAEVNAVAYSPSYFRPTWHDAHKTLSRVRHQSWDLLAPVHEKEEEEKENTVERCVRHSSWNLLAFSSKSPSFSPPSHISAHSLLRGR